MKIPGSSWLSGKQIPDRSQGSVVNLEFVCYYRGQKSGRIHQHPERTTTAARSFLRGRVRESYIWYFLRAVPGLVRWEVIRALKFTTLFNFFLSVYEHWVECLVQTKFSNFGRELTHSRWLVHSLVNIFTYIQTSMIFVNNSKFFSATLAHASRILEKKFIQWRYGQN